MLQEMDHIEVFCVVYVEIGRFDQFEHRKISVLNVSSLGIVMLIVHYDSIVNV